MRIAVLGGGHGCYAAAAELSENGHDVVLWRRDAAALRPVIESGAITVTDRAGTRPVPISTIAETLAEAVKGAHLIVLPLPANSHESLAGQLAPLLEDGQVLFMAPGTLGTLVFARAMQAAGNSADVSFAETGTLPYLVRKNGEASVRISAYAVRLPTGIFPLRNADRALAIVQAAYPAAEFAGTALSGALMNIGPIIHPPLILMNAGPLEHFPSWDIHNEGTQPSIRRVTTALDHERIGMREALGYGPPHFPLAHHYDPDAEEEWLYSRTSHSELTDSGDWRETIDLLHHRYMTEDCALGVPLLVSVGRWLGYETPIASAMLSIASAVVGRDLYATGRTLEQVGLASLNRAEMERTLENGF